MKEDVSSLVSLSLYTDSRHCVRLPVSRKSCAAKGQRGRKVSNTHIAWDLFGSPNRQSGRDNEIHTFPSNDEGQRRALRERKGQKMKPISGFRTPRREMLTLATARLSQRHMMSFSPSTGRHYSNNCVPSSTASKRPCLNSGNPLFHSPLSPRGFIRQQRNLITTPKATSIPANEAFKFNAPSTRPLEGITIVALEQVISMPLATRHLSDLGARVIKIERPGSGDFVRHHDRRVRDTLCSHFVWINRNKESLALDIKKPEDMAVLKRLVCEKADVFVQNLRPGDAEKMGLGYEDVKAMMNDSDNDNAATGEKGTEKKGDRLIYASISGYGPSGPYAQKKAYDLLIQAEAGLLSITGTEGDDGMVKVGCSIADIAAGMYAYSSILGAILQRQRTGKGCSIDVSMLEALVEWMGFPMYYAHEGQSGPKRAGASHASIYPYGPFSTTLGGQGGAKVMLGVQNEREWTVLATEVLGREDLTTDPKFKDTASRSENRAELEAIISGIFASWDGGVDEVTRRLDKAGIANAKVNDMQGVWDHAQLQARDRWREVDSEVGSIKALIPPGMGADVEARMERIPAVGEHNDRILKELGIN